MNFKDWNYIVQEFREKSIHFDRIKICYDTFVFLYKSLKLKRTSIISNSLVFYHKYYIYNLFINSALFNRLKDSKDNKELICIGIACFFISLKISNYLVKIDYLLDNIFNNNILVIKDNNDKIIIRNMVLDFETDILYSINFDLEHDLPYNYAKNLWGKLSNKILEYLNNSKNNINNINNNFLNNEDNTRKLNQIKEHIAEILNYSFLFPFFLYYNSTIIALSCLTLALKKFNMQKIILDIISNHKEMKIISIKDIDLCSSLIDEIIISKIKSRNNEEEINNINNINLQNLALIKNNVEENNEPKFKLTDTMLIRKELVVTKKQK